jgi:hypothetical protein
MNVVVMTIVLAVSGMLAHGFFEVLQGNTPTPGLIIQAIGPEQRMWVHGSEEAFTLVPNFLATGLLAMAVSLALIVWVLGFVHKKHGPLVLLLLFALLFLVGGGIAQVLFFVPLWAASTRINRPLTWWRGVLSRGLRPWLARLWPWFLAVAVALFLIGLLISITGFFPVLTDPDQILYADWSILIMGGLFFFLAFVAGFARDILRTGGPRKDRQSWKMMR